MAAVGIVVGTVADKVPSAAPTGMSRWIPACAGMTSHSDGDATDDNRAAVADTVGTVGGGVGNDAVATRDAGLRPLRPSFNDRAVAVGDAHVRPVADSALRPDDATIATNVAVHKSSFPQDAGIQRQGCNAGLAQVADDDDTVRGAGCPRPAGMTSRSNFRADDTDRAVVATTNATTNATVGNDAVAAATDTVIDGTVAGTGAMKKQNFHTGLDPVSRTDNSAQPSEFNAGVGAADKVRFAQLFSLDTGSSPVWSVVDDTDATDDDRAAVSTVASGGDGVGDDAVATVTVTNHDDATVVLTGNHP